MGLVAVVAFCTAVSSGSLSPVPPFECVWRDSLTDNATYETMEECNAAATKVVNDIELGSKMAYAVIAVYDAPAYQFYIYCEPELKLKEFYKQFQVDTSKMGDYS